MDLEQSALLLLLAALLLILALEKGRMEVVALCGLLGGVLVGAVPLQTAFAGFADPAFITVAEILLVVKALGRIGFVDPLARSIPRFARTQGGILALLCVASAALSTVMNNIGALALMLPVVASISRVSGIDQKRLLMPVSFATLLGGMCSIIGTPANLIVSQQLREVRGIGFHFLDFAWVGIPATLVGLSVLVMRFRIASGRNRPTEDGVDLPMERVFVCETMIPKGSRFDGTLISASGIALRSLRRDGKNILFHLPESRFAAGDILTADMSWDDIAARFSEGALSALRNPARKAPSLIKVVVMPDSTLLGSRLASLAGLASRDVVPVAVAGRHIDPEMPFADIRLSIGDVLCLAGEPHAVREAAGEAEVLLLEPKADAGERQGDWLVPLSFAGGIILAATGLMLPEFAFGLVILALSAGGALDLRKDLADLDWPILLMLAATIPLGQAIESTGSADVLAQNLLHLLPSQNAWSCSMLMLTLAVCVTPFVNNATTAIILGPIALRIASEGGFDAAPLLIAVALGASTDFLTPIGHHNNTIVMGIAGYRFSDFLKAGWSLTLAVCLVSGAAIYLAWR